MGMQGQRTMMRFLISHVGMDEMLQLLQQHCEVTACAERCQHAAVALEQLCAARATLGYQRDSCMRPPGQKHITC
jgi:hypothetical protein